MSATARICDPSCVVNLNICRRADARATLACQIFGFRTVLYRSSATRTIAPFCCSQFSNCFGLGKPRVNGVRHATSRLARIPVATTEPSATSACVAIRRLPAEAVPSPARLLVAYHSRSGPSKMWRWARRCPQAIANRANNSLPASEKATSRVMPRACGAVMIGPKSDAATPRRRA
jgi:hypothetical protein